MKKKILATVMATLVVAAAFTGCSSKKSEGGDTIKIGGIGPLTGKASTYGQSVKEGAELYQDEINNAGGINGKKVQFVFEDDEADPNKAIQAFNKLVDDEGVTAILGAVTSGASKAVGPLATSKSIPMITPSSTEPNITKDGGDFVFRGCFIDSYQGKILAKYTTDTLKKKKAAVLYNVASDYSKGIADAYKAELEKNGGTVAEFLTYNDSDKDFNAQLTKIKASNPDVLVLPDYYNVVGLIAKQAKDMGINAQLLGGDGWESQDLTKIGGTAVNGALYLNHYYTQDTDKNVSDFVSAYKKKFSKDPDAFAALAYDSAKILVKAIEAANSTDGDKIREQLLKTDLQVVTGKVTFDADRTAVKGAVIIKVDGDKKTLVDKVQP
ncbi:ABC transporter substrate-binding protein [Clostridium sp. 'White wine YQ']|uniref:ABC transporter substrate-binding protein n=1 Tax=Clostridium sp. 'White wine YQ' TaxID=3027474 RepID=UPI002366382C|nr:ABC transporter substrate-binding protein [Clostridium sp. 'White wine YQ']MDD7793036.1 ABC transporter substrate-binding protein [Clostridium sp. 'White wine YQ']